MAGDPGRRHIVLIAPPWYPVPPSGYGGIELVVALLTRELRALGHRVTVFAADGSAPGTTVCAPGGLDTHLGQTTGLTVEMAYLATVFDRLRDLDGIDVIHDHSGLAGVLGSTLIDRAPVCHTVHGVIPPTLRSFYQALGEQADLIAISDSQRRSAPELAWHSVVHNAVDVDALTVAPPDMDRPYLLCLARVCPEKGQHLAVEAARHAGYPLVLAGKVEQTPAGRAYFAEMVRPHVDGDRVVYVHNVAGRQKAELLARATALLAPITWDEPFGLAVAEAMASGTPAIGFGRGAVPELVEDGVTGFVVDDVGGMVAALGRVEEIDVEVCAMTARRRFSPRTMARAHLRAYDALVAGDEAEVAATGSGVLALHAT